MIALVMAGGKGTRMNSPEEKLLLKHHRPTILQVISALQSSNCFSKIIAATSPHSPKTKELLQNQGIEIFETPGEGYVSDLNLVLRSFNDEIFLVPGDLPLLDAEIIAKIVEESSSKKPWTSFLVTQDYLHSIGLDSEYSIEFKNKVCYFTGISIIDSTGINNLESIPESHCIINDKRIAFNLNTIEDFNLLSTQNVSL